MPCLEISSSVTGFGRQMIENTKQQARAALCINSGAHNPFPPAFTPIFTPDGTPACTPASSPSNRYRIHICCHTHIQTGFGRQMIESTEQQARAAYPTPRSHPPAHTTCTYPSHGECVAVLVLFRPDAMRPQMRQCGCDCGCECSRVWMRVCACIALTLIRTQPRTLRLTRTQAFNPGGGALQPGRQVRAIPISDLRAHSHARTPVHAVIHTASFHTVSTPPTVTGGGALQPGQRV